MAVVSTNDRIMGALTLAVAPLAVGVVATILNAKALAAMAFGVGIVGGVIGAVGAGWFVGKGGVSPLAKRGWADGYPTGTSTDSLIAEVNEKLVASGGYAYDPVAFGPEYSTETHGIDQSPNIIRTKSVDRSTLNGLGGFWALQ